MKKCNKCGKVIIKATKYCPSCGNELDENRNKSNILNKCPSCGEKLKPFDTVCPACGCENIEKRACRDVEKLSNKIESIQNNKTKLFGLGSLLKNSTGETDAINNFVISNNKEDIIELMMMAVSKINPDDFNSFNWEKNVKNRKISEAWICKYEEAYQKSLILFPNDDALNKVNVFYQDKMVQVIKQKRKVLYLIAIYVGAAIILFAFAAILSYAGK